MAAPKPAPRGQTLPHAYHRRRRQMPGQWHTRHLESFGRCGRSGATELRPLWPVGGNCPTTAAPRTGGAKASTSFSVTAYRQPCRCDPHFPFHHGVQKAMPRSAHVIVAPAPYQTVAGPFPMLSIVEWWWYQSHTPAPTNLMPTPVITPRSMQVPVPGTAPAKWGVWCQLPRHLLASLYLQRRRSVVLSIGQHRRNGAK
jgi:hypothetical protein